MDLRQLECFVAVAEELHFARAAAKLHVAQPSISQRIKTLEAELGLELFERTSRAVTLSPGGAEILPLATQLLADARRLQEQAAQSARRLSGRIRIGFLADEYIHPQGDRVIATLRREQPRVGVEFQQIDFAEAHTALLDGQVDVAFVMGPVTGPFVSVALFESPRLLAVSRADAGPAPEDAGGRGAAAGGAGLEGLEGAAVVFPTDMTSHEWRRAWTPPSSESDQVFVVAEKSMEAMLAAVGAGRGVCVVPEYVSRFYPQPGVAFLEIDGLAPCTVEIAALRARQAEPLVAAVLAIARRTAGQ